MKGEDPVFAMILRAQELETRLAALGAERSRLQRTALEDCGAFTPAEIDSICGAAQLP